MATNYERRMRYTRAVENSREKLLCSLKEDGRVNQVNQWQKTASQQRWKQQRAVAESEERIMIAAQNRELEQRKKLRRAAQEVALADKLREQNDKAKGEAARIQLIIQNDPRLKELQSNLKLAYINKARAVQLKEKTMFERMTKAQEAAMEDEMERLRLAEEAKSGDAMVELRSKQREQKEFLLKQMEDKRSIVGETAAKEYARDKQLVDAVIEGIAREQEAEARAKMQKQEETRIEIQQYQMQWEKEKKTKAAAALELDRKILEYQKAGEAREAAKVAKKKEKEAREEKIYQQILAQQEEKVKRKAHDEIVADRETLAQEELEQREALKEEARNREILRMKQEMIDANEAQKRYKKANQKVLAAEEEAVRARMRAKYQEDDRKEQLRIAQHKEELRQHKFGIQKQKEGRAVQYELARQRELEEEAKNRENERFKEQVVREAARRLIEEHKQVLRDYQPATLGGWAKEFKDSTY